MPGRLDGKVAVIVGAGQLPGETIGNGRAMAILFAREKASVLCVDCEGDRAEETVAQVLAEGGAASAVTADIARAADCARIVAECQARYGRLDILVNNVGIAGNDAPAHRLTEEIFDRTLTVNLKGMWLTIKATLPVMREQGGGAIINISSLSAIAGADKLAYELSKAGVNRLTTSVAQSNARHGIRCNAIMMGFMDTPMAIGRMAEARGLSTDQIRAERNARVPLRGRMGDAWDTARAALFLASDDAAFISGALLPVDGAMGVRIG